MAMPMTADADDRRTCAQCQNGNRPGPCQAVRTGQIVASRQYEPDRELLRRCEGYRPDKTDPDQRPGNWRWPNLNALPETKERKTK